MNRLAREARETARKSGDGRLPHEILLDIARGHPVELLYLDEKTGKPKIDEDTGEMMKKLVLPSLDDIKDAAKAAAPYFAPKISTVEVIQGISDHELDAIIERAASEAGVVFGTAGEGEAPEAPEPDSPRRRRSIE